MGKVGLSRDHTHSDIGCALLMKLQKIIIEWSLVLYVSANYHYTYSILIISRLLLFMSKLTISYKIVFKSTESMTALSEGQVLLPLSLMDSTVLYVCIG